jgi:hypothetical protein
MMDDTMPCARARSLLLLATLALLTSSCALATALGDEETDQAPGAEMGDGAAEMGAQLDMPDMPVEPTPTTFDTLDECIRSGCEENNGICVAYKAEESSSCLGPSQVHERCTISQKIEPALSNPTALATLMPDSSVAMLVQGGSDEKHLIRFTEDSASSGSAQLPNFVAHAIVPGMPGTINVLAMQGQGQGQGLSLSSLNLMSATSSGSVSLRFSMADSPPIKLCGNLSTPIFGVSYVFGNEQRFAAVFCEESMSGARWQLSGFKPEFGQNMMLASIYTDYGLMVPGPYGQATFSLNLAKNPELAYLVKNTGPTSYKLDPYSFDPSQGSMSPKSVAGNRFGEFAAYDLPPTGPLAQPCPGLAFGEQSPRLWIPTDGIKDRVHIVAAGPTNYQILAPAMSNTLLLGQFCQSDGARYTLRDTRYGADMRRAALLFERLDTSATEPGIYVDMFGGVTAHDAHVVLSPTSSDNNLKAVAALPLDNRVIITGLRTHNGEQQAFAMNLSPQARPFCRHE